MRRAASTSRWLIEAKGNDLDISERSVGDDSKAPSTGNWRGSLKAGDFIGTWVDPRHKTSLPIALHRIGRATPGSSGALRDIDATSTPYEWRWTQLRLTYSNGAETKVGDLGYRLVKDGAFGLRYPRLTLFPDQQAMAAANRTLAGIGASSVIWMRDNMNNAREARAVEDAKPFNTVAEAGMNQQDSIKVTRLVAGCAELRRDGLLGRRRRAPEPIPERAHDRSCAPARRLRAPSSARPPPDR